MPRGSIPALMLVALTLAGPATARAQGKAERHYAVTTDRAILVTREVLVRQGYEVVRIEERGPEQVIHYRRGNMGQGKGKGPPMTMVIRRTEDRVVFVGTPDVILFDIDVRLRVPVP